MKKTHITLLFLGLSLAQYAQLEKGRILLGGNFSYSGRNDDQMDTTGKVYNKVKSTELDLNVRAGYFITDQVVLGLLVGFGSSDQTSDNFGTSPSMSSDISKSSSTSFGAFARMYRMMGESRFAVFGQLAFTYGMGKGTNEDVFVNSQGESTSTKTRSESGDINLGIAPGIAFFLSDRIALEATIGNIGYAMTTTKSYNNSDRFVGETKGSTMNVSFNPSSIFFGITFFIGGGSGEAK